MKKTTLIFLGMGALVLLVLLGIYFWASHAERGEAVPGVTSVRHAIPELPVSETPAPVPPAPDEPWLPFVGAWLGQKSFTSASRRSGEPVDVYAYVVVDEQGDVMLEIDRKMATDGEMHGHYSITKPWPGDFERDGKVLFGSPNRGEIHCWWYAAKEGQVIIPITKVANKE